MNDPKWYFVSNIVLTWCEKKDYRYKKTSEMFEAKSLKQRNFKFCFETKSFLIYYWRIQSDQCIGNIKITIRTKNLEVRKSLILKRSLHFFVCNAKSSRQFYKVVCWTLNHKCQGYSRCSCFSFEDLQKILRGLN